MAKLTPILRAELIRRANSINVKTLLEYILTGEISLSEIPNLAEDRRIYIEHEIGNMPNPNEQAEWNEIESIKSNPILTTDLSVAENLRDRLAEYIGRWKNVNPPQNHVEEAKEMRRTIEEKIAEIVRNVEESDWNKVDTFSKTALLKHLSTYPSTTHKDEIDDLFWELTNKENFEELQNYQSIFPQGRHFIDSKRLLDSFVEWDNIRNTNDIFLINDYLRNNPETPFQQQALTLVTKLKQAEIEAMRNSPNTYEVTRLFNLLNREIFSDFELINAGVITQNILEVLRNSDIKSDLPDVYQAIEKSYAECKEGYTDVYFFGVPSTGKTCVLMGLSRSKELHINLASGGGEYASTLQQYTDLGMVVPATPGSFVTSLEATITQGGGKAEAVHKINLIEMAGEDFVYNIANNPEHVFTFEDMGHDATRLLSNENRKVFFLIIDPTTNIIKFNRWQVDKYDEETGEPLERHFVNVIANQRTVINKMVNLFEAPGNAEIMKKVDSIHIIMTKSDLLGNVIDREDKALRIFREKFEGDILEPLINLCKEYNINFQTNFHPNLYTFSLGNFYIGGLYEYDQTDSNRLVKAIKNSSRSVIRNSWWEKFKDSIN
ncbi:MAG: hypothetical protein SOZ80_02410 [Prevotella sp.]|uniref:hypothetical protein n=1 Tax=Prevotella sp. TaxID=59823 RepID=UPI002A2F7865|nr:hypothetical protein [Prevotella sp.]MDD7319104.1 hypothetical protein [Prevotellaceae bacterium]MDY4019621.1 hypothetical protein [Prevotella sp.]